MAVKGDHPIYPERPMSGEWSTGSFESKGNGSGTNIGEGDRMAEDIIMRNKPLVKSFERMLFL